MRVTLIVNPDAGRGGKDTEKFIRPLSRRGDEVHCISAADDYSAALDDPGDLIVVAGGDGTVAKVARTMGGRDTPILIAPTGTANNIATSLGIEKIELDLDKIRSKWRKQPIDAGIADDEIIIEAAGCGAVAHLIRKESDDKRKGIRREAKNLAAYLNELPAFDYRVTTADGELAGEAVLIDVMVISHVGPNLLLAPDALPGDGLLDLVIVKEKDREPLQRYLASGGRRQPPRLPAVRGREFTIACDAPWHFDDELKPRRTRSVSVRLSAWQAMVPFS